MKRSASEDKLLVFRARCRFSCAFFVVLLLAAGASVAQGKDGVFFHPPAPPPDDRVHLPEPPPERSSINDIADAIQKQFALPLELAFDWPRQVRRLAGSPKEALNVDAFDEVPDNAWFTNRNARRPLTLDQIRRGPNTTGPPDPETTWTIWRAKADGVTPGFAIVDGHGNRYFIKFDPPGYNELASGAEVVSTKLFHAAGYNTPENYIVHFDPAILRMGNEVKFVDEKGRKRFMNREDLEEILERVEYMPDGRRTRAMASLLLPGRPLGPFRYEDLVEEDPNDWCPHQHRRELRGLYVFGSWLNHIDSKAQNSLDTYVTLEDGRSYVRHYLIDFGTCLGSGGRGPHPRYRGHESEADPGAFLRKVLSFGLWVREYEKPDTVLHPSIGRYSIHGFHPARFTSIFPNPAYMNRTLRDCYWGAKLVMSFSDEQLAAAVETGQYSDPRAAAYLLKQLKLRRDRIGRYWFERMAPLDNFHIERKDGRRWLAFDDLAVATGLQESEEVAVRYALRQSPEEPRTYLELPVRGRVELPAEIAGQLEVALKRRTDDDAGWSPAVLVYLQGESGGVRIAGVQRED